MCPNYLGLPPGYSNICFHFGLIGISIHSTMLVGAISFQGAESGSAEQEGGAGGICVCAVPVGEGHGEV